MSKLASVLGLLCFAGIVAYWYFLPYQIFLALTSSGNLLGPILANVIVFVLLCMAGMALSTLLIMVGLHLLAED